MSDGTVLQVHRVRVISCASGQQIGLSNVTPDKERLEEAYEHFAMYFSVALSNESGTPWSTFDVRSMNTEYWLTRVCSNYDPSLLLHGRLHQNGRTSSWLLRALLGRKHFL